MRKKIISFVILTALIIADSHLTFSAKDRKMITPDNNLINYTGRFDFSNPRDVTFAWSASAISFRFTGNYCTLQLLGDTDTNYVSIFIDNMPPIVIRITRSDQAIPIPGLDNGEHILTVFKRTEANQGILHF